MCVGVCVNCESYNNYVKTIVCYNSLLHCYLQETGKLQTIGTSILLTSINSNFFLKNLVKLHFQIKK